MARKLKTIYEYFPDYTVEQVNNALQKLTDSEKEIIKKAYGDDLLNPIRSKSFKTSDSNKLYGSIIPRIKTELNGRKINLCFYEKFKGYSKQQVDSCVKQLSEKEQILLKKAYGEDFSQKNDIDKQEQIQIRTIIVKKIKRLLAGENLGRNIQSLYKNFDSYTKEQIDSIIESLSDDEKLLIKKAYGEDFEHPKRALDWSSEDSKLLYQRVFVKIKALLKDKYLRKYFSIYERLSKFSKDEIDEVIKTLPAEDQNVLKIVYGEDLENPKKDIDYNDDIDSELRRIIYEMENILSKEERKNNKKIGKLYDLLKGYSRAQIDKVIADLSDSDKELLYRAYGNDFENPVRCSDFTKKEQNKLTTSLLPKIRKLLKDSVVEQKTDIVDNNENGDTSFIESDNVDKVKPVEQKEDMTKEAYIELLSMLRTPSFKKLLNTLDVESAVIVVLKLGYIRDNYYSSSSIGNFLGISEEEVNFKFANVLELYKKLFNDCVDNAVKILDKRKLN